MSFSLRKIEFLRWILLGAISLIVFRPMLFGVDIGAGDAYVYHQIVADALEQYHHHVFPIYVGQSLFNFAGAPMGRGPYFLFLIGLINLLTLGKLNSLQIQHATIIFSALAGAYLMYFTLSKIAPKHRWVAFAFAIFYITCPAILGLIAKMDMYFSFMPIPFLPILIYALIRNFQKNDLLSYVLFAASLSLIWMAHPSIAFWCSAVSGIFFSLRMIFQPKVITGLFFCGFLFISLSLWQFTTVFTLKMSQYISMGTTPAKYAVSLINFYKSNLLGTFLPVDLQNGTYAYYQLGYSLWLALLIGIIVAIKKRNILLNYLILCAIFFVILISPFPYLSEYLWAHLPMSVIGLSNDWPMERIYLILAALSCFIGVLALQDIYPNKQANKLNPRIVAIPLMLMTAWSFYQSTPFTKYLAQYLYLKPAWLLPENSRHRLEYFSGYNHKPLLEGIYEPALYNRLLGSDGKEIENYNNNKVMAQTCLSNSNGTMKSVVSDLKTSFPAQFKLQKTDVLTPLMKVKVMPGIKYMLCFDIAPNASGVFSIDGDKHETISLFARSPKAQAMLIPVFTTESSEKELNVTLIQSTIKNDDKYRFIRLNSFNIKPYDTSKLPIKLHSLIPYRVTVKNPMQFSYLETAREFIDGYVALVNGKERKVSASSSGRVMVPLFPGNNEVVLLYKGTLAVRSAFYFSLFFWIAVIAYLGSRIFIHSPRTPTISRD